jgi:hypothetical protein
MRSCDCGVAYLIETRADGAHNKMAGDAEAIRARYEALPGLEIEIRDARGVFFAKRLEPEVDLGAADRSSGHSSR